MTTGANQYSVLQALESLMGGNNSGGPDLFGFTPQNNNEGGFLNTLTKFTPAAQLGMSALGTLGGLYSSNKMLGLARDQFNHARDVTNTNLTNQIQSYNTALAGRARARGAMEGQDQATIDKYIQENRLTR